MSFDIKVGPDQTAHCRYQRWLMGQRLERPASCDLKPCGCFVGRCRPEPVPKASVDVLRILSQTVSYRRLACTNPQRFAVRGKPDIDSLGLKRSLSVQDGERKARSVVIHLHGGNQSEGGPIGCSRNFRHGPSTPRNPASSRLGGGIESQGASGAGPARGSVRTEIKSETKSWGHPVGVICHERCRN